MKTVISMINNAEFEGICGCNKINLDYSLKIIWSLMESEKKFDCYRKCLYYDAKAKVYSVAGCFASNDKERLIRKSDAARKEWEFYNKMMNEEARRKSDVEKMIRLKPRGYNLVASRTARFKKPI